MHGKIINTDQMIFASIIINHLELIFILFGYFV